MKFLVKLDFSILGFRSLSDFSVDDQWRYAPDQQTQTDEHGNINNVLDISGFRHLQFKTVSESEQVRVPCKFLATDRNRCGLR